MNKLSAFAALWQAIRGQRRSDAPALGEQMAALPRLIGGTLRGEYGGMGKGRLLAMIAALVYIVSPIDIIPEGLFMFFGLGDDAVVLSWLAGTVLAETEAFMRWERREDAKSSRIVVGEVV